MSTGVNRRRLLQLLLALGTSVAMPASAASGNCAAAVLGQLDLDSVRELGREYLASRSDGTAVDAVASLLASSRNEAEVLAELRGKVLADFTAGRIVNLAGWFVSDTEGCVFAALSRCDF